MDTNQNNTLNHTTDTYHFWAEEVSPAPEPALTENISSPDTMLPGEEVPEAVDAPKNAETAKESESDIISDNVNFSEASEDSAFADSISSSDIPSEKKKKKGGKLKKFFGCIGLAACFGIVAGGAFFGVKYAFSYFFPEETVHMDELTGNMNKPEKRPEVTIASTALSNVGDTDASEIVATVVEQTMPAMVSIQTLTTTTNYFWGQPISNENEGGGSGIIVGSNESDLLIATNYHVIEGTSSVKAVLADGTTHTVTVKGSDPQADLAILALPLSGLTQETLDNIDIAVLGDSDSSRIGQMVIAIGNSLGYGPTVTVGYLSAKDRELTISGNDMVLLQTNAAINSGNSGGALLNTKGEVIGINNAKLSSTEIEGICFAIPISSATPILNELMTKEILSDTEKGYLGVTVTELDPSVFQIYNWPEGVYVSDVAEGSAAEKAGIYKGDIITHVNDKKVTTANQLVNAVTSNRIGAVVEITLQRVINGQHTEFKYSVTLQQNPTLTEATPH